MSDAAAEALGLDLGPCNCPPLREMRAALADRNGLARECANLRDQVADLTKEVDALRPLATAAREFVIVEQEEGHGADRVYAWQSLKDAADAWWER